MRPLHRLGGLVCFRPIWSSASASDGPHSPADPPRSGGSCSRQRPSPAAHSPSPKSGKLPAGLLQLRELLRAEQWRQYPWRHRKERQQLPLGLISRLLADGSLSARTTGLLALIETPEAMEGYLLRAQGQDDA
ncbi:hypothetical protein KBY58_12195 [Cyanobium sp. HWJ4-Hawea]|uniref:hypothetical protein n=1 Tax=Cyanobium sp. HWJ4-Hawea TaxID=2823713 RepID=UPI0020CBD53D|nr:hypothetical protein [Cyanobium sp. HWJ4-Hawea]MCP9810190.1 hypothetical protein [Cyanobium sp. HWJ4-Hawea]